MANTTGGDKLQLHPWTAERQLRLPAAIPSASTTFYAGQAVGRDLSGNMVQMDDTARADFLGILEEFIRVTVDTTDTVQQNGLQGDKMFTVTVPQTITALIAAAAAGDEGRKVYWKYNNEVSYSAGSFGNLAGQVWFVKDATHVTFLPPWLLADYSGAKAIISLSGAGPTITLTKFDIGKTLLIPAAAPITCVLPAVAKCGSGDTITIVNTGSGSQVITLDGNAAELINGATTLAMSGTQYTAVTLQTDGSAWYRVA